MMVSRCCKRVFFVVLLLLQSVSSVTGQESKGAAQAGETQKDKPKYVLPAIAAELTERVARDQEARMAMIEAQKAGDNDDPKLVELNANVVKIDNDNRSWMVRQTKMHGWLGRSLVGEVGAHNAWLLVQHADRDLPFQKRCLALMTKMPAGEVAPVDIAYLTDRVLSAEGKPQRYGTQCSIENGKALVKSVEDPENLNRRRATLGLEPIEKYLTFVESVYVKPKSDPKKAAATKAKGNLKTGSKKK